MGSGSTIAAASYFNIQSVGVEIDAKYFQMARSAIPKLASLQPDARPPLVRPHLRRGSRKSGAYGGDKPGEGTYEVDRPRSKS